jgi:hypothetical protein
VENTMDQFAEFLKVQKNITKKSGPKD